MKTNRLIVLMLVMVMAFACTVNREITPTTKLLYMYQIYNAQYQDYLSMAESPNLTEDQKAMLRIKRPILTKLQLLIPIYDTSVTMGVPDAQTEQEIYDLLNSLNQ